MDGTTLIRDLAAPLALALLSVAMNAAGSGARQAVKAQPGEIVLLRDVSARPAYRMAPPGMALIADPKPQREIAAALGTRAGSGAMDELSDEDYAGMGAGHAAPASAPGGTTVERVTQQALGGTLGRSSDGMAGSSLGGAMSGPLGAVGNSTRGIGDTVRGALAQFPLQGPAPAGGK
ncbi:MULTISPECIES: hypothetical protein [Stenotrophomonas]|uniref:Uncharacterized protein n=1 Tax=Stenotrophomonas maltophilia TaxID=40324 RepID=A0A2J0SM20_STEMA|nr:MULTISPECIES: hypothetical protein [Stenotrophomonas]MBA0310754.1 hypothetical protein [Stenotrophomonas maltophilia]MBH1744558.1 hypothetical protein [Stenotrophomonas maltophilia]MBH1863727.1 hypothetical protein [Stenotrophomonas maltophilia]MDH1387707.1 hypothetical protein [Stenotrophomonas sp. GD03701]MDH1391809.1 hypothetical protein [Stenotrophomonas sp. GD03702]